MLCNLSVVFCIILYLQFTIIYSFYLIFLFGNWFSAEISFHQCCLVVLYAMYDGAIQNTNTNVVLPAQGILPVCTTKQ